MRVVHIIPSAFNYFDDIRSRAFAIMDEEHKAGVEVEAITLQYDNPSRAVKQEVKESAPSVHSYNGHTSIDEAVFQLDDFDLVHLHAPFFGAGGDILRWTKSRQKPFIITYYRAVSVVDIFSIFIKLYNWYYLSKLFKLADFTVDVRQEKNLSTQNIAENYISLYNTLT